MIKRVVFQIISYSVGGKTGECRSTERVKSKNKS